MSSTTVVESIDCTNEDAMEVFGATLLQHGTLSSGIDLLHYHHLPAELPATVSQQHLILLNTDVPPDIYVEQITEGQRQTAQMKVEDVIIVPAQIEASARWNQAHSYLALCLEPMTLEQRVRDLVKGYSVELVPQFACSDALLHSIGRSLQAELATPGFGGSLYIDSLLTTLITHLLRHYCIQESLKVAKGGLSTAKLDQVLDYIQAHLDQNLALVDLAAIAQVSPNYFATQFKQTMGIAPHQYLIQQRIERAKRLIATGKGSIAAIASSVGFADQSHFTRHFKRLVGVTPKKFLANQ